VIAALDASGHLLEQQVATEVEGFGYAVQTNRAYTDTEEGKSRELDVYAYRQFFGIDKRRLWVGMHLLIECKQTHAPFAFLTRPVPRRHRPPEEVLITLHSREEKYEEDGRQLIRKISTFESLGLADLYWGATNNVKAVHISRLDRKSGEWRADNTGVFDSLTWPLAKALRAFKAPFRNRNRGFDPRSDAAFVMFFIPIVVVPSKLYTVDGTARDPVAREVDHVRFQRELKAGNFTGLFAIDFVHRQALGKFVGSTVNGFGERVAEIIEANPEAVIPPEKWPMWSDW
jgi:hypothetical protein